MKIHLEDALAPLPHNLRRRVFAMLRPGVYKRMSRLRQQTNAGPDANSLAGFDKLGCIFVHIPKAAGVSVCHSLFGNLGGGHLDLRRYQMIFSEDDYDRYFKFSFVRNPWDRLYSAYRFLSSGGMNDSDARWAAEHLSAYPDFKGFVMQGLSNRKIIDQKHMRSQCDYLKPAGRVEPGVDFIGRFESIEQDFRTIGDRLGLDVELQKKNVTLAVSHTDYRDVYNDEMVEQVGVIYKDDIDTFGYSFNATATDANKSSGDTK